MSFAKSWVIYIIHKKEFQNLTPFNILISLKSVNRFNNASYNRIAWKNKSNCNRWEGHRSRAAVVSMNILPHSRRIWEYGISLESSIAAIPCTIFWDPFVFFMSMTVKLNFFFHYKNTSYVSMNDPEIQHFKKIKSSF